MSDYKLKLITGKTSLSFRLRYAILHSGGWSEDRDFNGHARIPGPFWNRNRSPSHALDMELGSHYLMISGCAMDL